MRKCAYMHTQMHTHPPPHTPEQEEDSLADIQGCQILDVAQADREMNQLVITEIQHPEFLRQQLRWELHSSGAFLLGSFLSFAQAVVAKVQLNEGGAVPYASRCQALDFVVWYIQLHKHSWKKMR